MLADLAASGTRRRRAPPQHARAVEEPPCRPCCARVAHQLRDPEPPMAQLLDPVTGTFGYNKAIVKYFTYAIDGLSENDFICAAKLDKITSI